MTNKEKIQDIMKYHEISRIDAIKHSEYSYHLIYKYLEDWQSPFTASIEHYAKTGKVTGSLSQAIEKIINVVIDDNIIEITENNFSGYTDTEVNPDR